MDSKKVMELLADFKLTDRINPQNRESSILELLIDEYDKYMNRKDKDRDEEVEELFDQAIQYQKKVVAELDSSVFIIQNENPTKVDIAKTYANQISNLKGTQNLKETQNQNPKISSSSSSLSTPRNSQLNTVDAMWFVSLKKDAQIDAQFEEIKTHLFVGETEHAKKKLDAILDKEPTNAGAHLAMYLARAKIKTLDAFFQNKNLSFDIDNDLKRAMQYATPAQKNFAMKTLQERENERIYAKAMIDKISMKTSADCKAVAELFEKIGNYKDAPKQAAECRTKEKELSKKETEAQNRLLALQTETDEKQEIDRIHLEIFSGTSLSETKLNEYTKRLNELKGKYSEYDTKIKDALEKAKKILADTKKKATAAKIDAASKRFDGIVYAVVLIVMLYFAMSFRFSFQLVKYAVQERRIGSASEEMYEKCVQMVNMVDTFFSAGVIPPWNPYGEANRYVEIKDSPINYVLLLHDVDTLQFHDSGSVNIVSLQNVIPKIYYSSLKSKNLVVSKACGAFELRASTSVETVVLNNLVDGHINIVENDSLKKIEIKKATKDISINLVDCPLLETIILPADTRRITIDGDGDFKGQIQCENTNLEIVYEE